jgi:hypothetical protein
MTERVWHPPTTEHNYMVKLRAMVDDPRCPLVGGEFLDWNCDIKHDPWCDVLSGNYAGFCNCDPLITLTPMTMTTTDKENP